MTNRYGYEQNHQEQKQAHQKTYPKGIVFRNDEDGGYPDQDDRKAQV